MTHPLVTQYVQSRAAFDGADLVFRTVEPVSGWHIVMCCSPSGLYTEDDSGEIVSIQQGDYFAEKFKLFGDLAKITACRRRNILARFILLKEESNFRVTFTPASILVPGTSRPPSWHEAVLCFSIAPKVYLSPRLNIL